MQKTAVCVVLVDDTIIETTLRPAWVWTWRFRPRVLSHEGAMVLVPWHAVLSIVYPEG